MTNQSKALQYAVLFVFATICSPMLGQKKDEKPTQMLNHLAGSWVLEGVLGRRHVTHDVTAEWILNNEYLRMHEVSREKNKNGGPAYEAIIIISWDGKANEYRCLWLDNTEGGGLSTPTARAKPDGQSITFVFAPPNESLHTTFKYDDQSDRWQLTIDNVKDGKPYRFGDDTLTHSPRVVGSTRQRRPLS